MICCPSKNEDFNFPNIQPWHAADPTEEAYDTECFVSICVLYDDDKVFRRYVFVYIRVNFFWVSPKWGLRDYLENIVFNKNFEVYESQP